MILSWSRMRIMISLCLCIRINIIFITSLIIYCPIFFCLIEVSSSCMFCSRPLNILSLHISLSRNQNRIRNVIVSIIIAIIIILSILFGIFIFANFFILLLSYHIGAFLNNIFTFTSNLTVKYILTLSI